MAEVEGVVIERWHRPHLMGVIVALEESGRIVAVPWLTNGPRRPLRMEMRGASTETRGAIQSTLPDLVKTIRWQYRRLLATRPNELSPDP